MPHAKRMLVLVLLVAVSGACQRLADEPVEPIDFEALREDVCEHVCSTMDTCDPHRFEGLEPEDCFERCMTLMPRLLEENQCGSREMISLYCVGDLTCDEFEEYDEVWPPDDSTPCAAETRLDFSCSEDEPFDLDELVTSQP
jgi:hypothetical protein